MRLHRPQQKVLLSTLLALTSLHLSPRANAQAADVSIPMVRNVKRLQTPNPNIKEVCSVAARLPIGKYSNGDLKDEEKLCSIDFYSPSVALCPKVWSTSPGTIVHEVPEGMTQAEAEASHCGKDNSLDTLGKFKQTMNQPGTSGTFSMSSIMYYHLSRALDTEVTVPVAVFRTMDKKAHYNRVTKKAKPSPNAKMNVAGWKHMELAETTANYNAAADILTPNGTQIYGVLLRDKGNRYGAEFNGTREGAWGVEQSEDFEETPAYFALRSTKPLEQALSEGYDNAIKNPTMRKAIPVEPSRFQMKLWMNEASEIAVMDHIMSQQDRIGNIDYTWAWVYSENGVLKHKKVDSVYKDYSLAKKGNIKVPAEIAAFKPELVQRTSIGDNDAGGLIQYATFARKAAMVDDLRHIDKNLYARVQQLADDFRSEGPNYKVAMEEMHSVRAFEAKLENRANQFIKNTIIVADILKKNLNAKLLQLDDLSLKVDDLNRGL